MTRRVTDLAGVMSAAAVSDVETRLDTFERSTSNQIVVLIVPSMNGEALEDYTLRVAEKNKLGRKGRDNGVLLFVARDEHKVRIEVGYGLEGVLTDALSDQIIRHIIVPRFRANDYDGGISEGVDAILSATKGEFKGEGNSRGGRRNVPRLPAFLLILIFATLARTLARGLRRTTIGRGRFYSGGPWFGGFGGGGFGGGFGGFGGGGGGGFSGGGGSFGGGGASGSW